MRDEITGGGITARQKYLNIRGHALETNLESEKAVLDNIRNLQNAENEYNLIEIYKQATEELKRQGMQEIDNEYHERKASLDEFTKYAE